MGFRLFLHAFKTIFGNLPQALIISIIPFGAFLLLTVVLGEAISFDVGGVPSGGQIMGILVLVLVMIFVFGFIAASWHRFVLLNEKPQFIGGPATGRAFPYIGNSILLGLWLILFILPLMIVIGVLAVPFLGQDGRIGGGAFDYGWDDVAFEVIIGTIIGTIALMYSLVLPASAVGSSMTFRKSRMATTQLGFNLVVVTFCVIAFDALANFILLTVLAGSTGIVFLVTSLALQWLVLMVGISILTSLYGHLVEGRDLPS